MTEAGTVLPNGRLLLDFMRAYTAEYRMSPTVEEMAAHLGLSKSGAFRNLSKLVERGHVVKTGASTRQYVPANVLRPGDVEMLVSLPAHVAQALNVYAVGRGIAPETFVRNAVARALSIAEGV